jgi:hypothetical protein|tara:strand:- start:263 stop:592 length:330 start_codon:yes stop_codon:yes gene_type:complete
MLYTILLAAACKSVPVECLCPEDFVDVWWQIELSSGPVGNCYLFTADGHMVETDGIESWPIGQWELEYIRECNYSILTEDDQIDIIGYNEGCIKIEHDSKEYTACECIF